MGINVISDFDIAVVVSQPKMVIIISGEISSCLCDKNLWWIKYRSRTLKFMGQNFFGQVWRYRQSNIG